MIHPMQVIKIRDAKIMAVFIDPCPATIKAPRPTLDPMNSATTAPTQDSTSATLTPAKIKGAPLGILSQTSV